MRGAAGIGLPSPLPLMCRHFLDLAPPWSLQSSPTDSRQFVAVKATFGCPSECYARPRNVSLRDMISRGVSDTIGSHSSCRNGLLTELEGSGFILNIAHLRCTDTFRAVENGQRPGRTVHTRLYPGYNINSGVSQNRPGSIFIDTPY